MHTDVMLLLPIRWVSTYKIVKNCHVISLGNIRET